MFKVSDVENRYDELDVCVMSNAVDRAKATCLAECVFLRGTLDISQYGFQSVSEWLMGEDKRKMM